MYDFLFRGATVVTGVRPPFTADVATDGTAIAAVGDVRRPARRVVEARGRCLAPGLIDVHSHNDFVATQRRPFAGKITQGVTTEVIGNCGISGAPIPPPAQPFIRQSIPVIGRPGRGKRWETWQAYFAALRASPLPTNLVPLAGHGNIRCAAAGMRSGPARPEELRRMEGMTAEAMERGCRGISTGLIYPPGVFTPTEEIVALARTAARFGGIYATHIRGEGPTLLDALREAVRVGRESGAAVHVAHLKAAGRAAWGKTGEALRIIEDARSSGLDVTFDQYPYTASATTAMALLPPWSQEGGVPSLLERLADAGARRRVARDMEDGVDGWENYGRSCGWDRVILNSFASRRKRPMEGRTVAELSAAAGLAPAEFLMRELAEERGRIGMFVFSMSEESLREIMRRPFGFGGSDGLPGRRCHPRLWGTFARILGRYCRDERVLTLTEAVLKCSVGPAARYGLKDRGRIEAGAAADLLLFDPATIADRADYADAARPAAGVEWVLVNGAAAVADGRTTGVSAGRLLV